MTDLDKLIEAVEAGAAINGYFDDVFDLGPTGTDAIGAYNGYLDAAKRLHDALLPGWSWSVDDDGFVDVSKPRGAGLLPKEIASTYNTNPARAWLLAILRAIKAKGEQG